MTLIGRLWAEAVPDGTFGGARPPSARPTVDGFPQPRREVTPEEAAAHCAALVAELKERARRPAAQPARHLHAVPETPRSAA